jgi:hypothetical protein
MLIDIKDGSPVRYVSTLKERVADVANYQNGLDARLSQPKRVSQKFIGIRIKSMKSYEAYDQSYNMNNTFAQDLSRSVNMSNSFNNAQMKENTIEKLVPVDRPRLMSAQLKEPISRT